MDLEDAQTLLLLLQAPSKNLVDEIIVLAYNHRNSPEIHDSDLTPISDSLKTDTNQIHRLIGAIGRLIKKSIYGLMSVEQIADLFPSNFHKSLKGLISQIIARRMPEWRKDALGSTQFMPKLEDVNWRVDIKSASNALDHMAVPTLFVEMKVRDAPTSAGHLIDPESIPSKIVSFELGSGTLQTMLDSLGKIRDQLQAVSNAAVQSREEEDEEEMDDD
eukprot:TRINITY_DN2948_c0_g1_i1.p1 TRINITY_DN2948_c0_g1~~TRINITY_DN2948_c0_g1_i1.p1  ORF type:complete len:218 (-),score=56.01 TRINITY_DN2948_c0_g1_i1:52-705(-)